MEMIKEYHIPNPCHEDWSKMTPTARGAFCKSCNVEVVDFRNKTSEEIRSILHQSQEKKLCGNLTKPQLESIGRSFHLWENQSTRTFQSKFVMACILTFGLGLFTGCQDKDIEENSTIFKNVSEINSSQNSEGTFTLSTCVKGRFVPKNIGEYVANEMLLDPDYCDLIDRTKVTSEK